MDKGCKFSEDFCDFKHDPRKKSSRKGNGRDYSRRQEENRFQAPVFPQPLAGADLGQGFGGRVPETVPSRVVMLQPGQEVVWMNQGGAVSGARGGPGTLEYDPATGW